MFKMAQLPLHLTSFINWIFAKREPWEISAITAVSVLSGLWFWDLLREPESLLKRGKENFFVILKKISFISKKIDHERKKVYDMIEKEVIGRCEGLTYITELPDRRVSPNEIISLVKTHLSRGSYSWKEGYVSGAVYYYDETLADLMSEVYKQAQHTNPLHPDVFPGICKMEAEIIRIVANLFHGSSDACGSMTSGGTESILMACKAYRDYGRHVRGITYSEIVVPQSAHAAFDKAGSYLGMRVKHVAVDEHSKCVNIKAMEHAITRNTVMLVGSAPNFPYGTVDNIVQIAKLGLKYRIPVHVDCCLGSFVIAFMSQLGYEVQPFDFAVLGVTSISVDTHKYGFAPKGSSIILYSEPKYRHHQYYVSLSWPGGLYGSPSVSGSRSGAIIATCWATLMYFGEKGYATIVSEILSVTKYIEDELRKIPGIFVFGRPLCCVVAIGSESFHIYRLSQALNEKSWNLNMLQFPVGIHICVTQLHTLPGVAEKFVHDVRTEVEKILLSPNDNLEGKVAMYGMSTTLPDRTLVGDFTKCYLDAHYYTPNYTR